MYQFIITLTNGTVKTVEADSFSGAVASLLPGDSSDIVSVVRVPGAPASPGVQDQGGEAICKPSWDDAPEWAQWLAQDEDGPHYWFETEPHTTTDRHGRYWQAERGRVQRISKENPNPNWRDTLEQRPTQDSDDKGEQ